MKTKYANTVNQVYGEDWGDKNNSVISKAIVFALGATAIMLALGSGFGLWLTNQGLIDTGVMLRTCFTATGLIALAFFWQGARHLQRKRLGALTAVGARTVPARSRLQWRKALEIPQIVCQGDALRAGDGSRSGSSVKMRTRQNRDRKTHRKTLCHRDSHRGNLATHQPKVWQCSRHVNSAARR